MGQVEGDEICREPVRLRFGDDKLPRPRGVLGEMTPQRRDKGLQRAGRILRPLPRPEQVGQAIGRHAMAARGEQDLKHLLRPGAPQVTRTQRAAAVLDRERPEQADHQAPPILFFHAHALPYLRRSSFHISSARPTQLTGFRLLASMIRYTRLGSPLERSRRATTARCGGRGSRSHQDLVVTPVRWRPRTPDMRPRRRAPYLSARAGADGRQPTRSPSSPSQVSRAAAARRLKNAGLITAPGGPPARESRPAPRAPAPPPPPL